MLEQPAPWSRVPDDVLSPAVLVRLERPANNRMHFLCSALYRLRDYVLLGIRAAERRPFGRSPNTRSKQSALNRRFVGGKQCLELGIHINHLESERLPWRSTLLDRPCVRCEQRLRCFPQRCR